MCGEVIVLVRLTLIHLMLLEIAPGSFRSQFLSKIYLRSSLRVAAGLKIRKFATTLRTLQKTALTATMRTF